MAAAACRLGGSGGPDGTAKPNLPLHIAAEYGASMEVIQGLLENYPTGAAKPRGGVSARPRGGVSAGGSSADGSSDGGRRMYHWYPLELFESGRAGREAARAAQMRQRKSERPADLEALMQTLRAFIERSDLLFAYCPEAVPSRYSRPGRRARLYRKDWDRISRFVYAIRSEATDTRTSELGNVLSLAWRWMCGFSNPADPRDNCGASVGRVLSGLDLPALWKLSVASEPLRQAGPFGRAAEGGGRVVRMSNGKTVPTEFRDRRATTGIDEMLRQTWWQHRVTSFLSAPDAGSYSVACRRTRAAGVRLLSEVFADKPKGVWEIRSNDAPVMWQRLSDVLVTPECTHTVYLMYNLEMEGSPSQIAGGLMVVRTDKEDLVPNSRPPWGEAVVTSLQIPTSALSYSTSSSEVRMRYQHVPGWTYALWYHGGPGMLTVSNLRLRQLVHAADARGRTPLHSLLGAKGADVPPHSRLRKHVQLLLQARFGSGEPEDSVGDLPLHYALKCGVSEEVLRALIAADSSSLVETDREGRTPLHAAFLLSRDDPPGVGVIRALLTTPGENATKLKDSSIRLPLHIAAERGAGEAILRLIVDAYPDGCYRQNKDGDLPLHLLVRSGRATTTTVELLVRPIMSSETISKMTGGKGSNLPLHISAEYQCCYKVLETLLATYPQAADQLRTRNENGKSSSLYALDLFERWRPSVERRRSLGSSSSKGSRGKKSDPMDMAKRDMLLADFDLRSDLLFVYNPRIASPSGRIPFRKDSKRILRLQTLVRREAIQCADARTYGDADADMSDMAKRAWCFFSTFVNENEPDDHYADIVRKILKGVPTSIVTVLADVKDATSSPMPDLPVKECANEICGQIIFSRIRFVGRYLMCGEEGHPVHKSDACLVMRAKDYGAREEYLRVKAALSADYFETDVDDLNSAPGTINHDSLGNEFEVSLVAFVKFAAKIGVGEMEARREIMRHLGGSLPKVTHNGGGSSESISDLGDDDFEEEFPQALKARAAAVKSNRELYKDAFLAFCREHQFDTDGTRNVVIKFMMHRHQFKREKTCRSKLRNSSLNQDTYGISDGGSDWSLVPVIEDYDVDRIKERMDRTLSDAINTNGLTSAGRHEYPDDKDELYSLDIQEKNASIHNFSLYKYALVMPGGDRDLAEICMHEELGILGIRHYMLQVAVALQRLHEHCKGSDATYRNYSCGNSMFGLFLYLPFLNCRCITSYSFFLLLWHCMQLSYMAILKWTTLSDLDPKWH